MRAATDALAIIFLLGAAQVRPSGGEKALAEIWNEDKDHARAAVNAFAAACGAKFPKAADKSRSTEIPVRRHARTTQS